MKTFQDFEAVGESLKGKTDFIRAAISEHKNSEDYQFAMTAREYDKQRNTTIMNYMKLLYTMSGVAVPDNYSANHKIVSNFFNRFITQQNQYLLGNGLTLENEANKAKLGKGFDQALQTLGHNALVEKVSFGFWNKDHIEVLKYTEFVPLWDEETAGLRAGIRFWQVDADKPLRVTVFEKDGYTEYIQRKDEDMEEMSPKRPYLLKVAKNPIDGKMILDGMNYPNFPVIPLWGNPARQSELVGLRHSIDAFDLIKSGFANDLDDASQIYWILENAGGMNDVEIKKFLERMKIVKGAALDDGQKATAHTIEIPYESRVAYLERLEQDMYNDFQALNVTALTGGEKTATEIKAAYQPFDNKVDQYEYCVLEFLEQLFKIVGIEDNPTFKRSRISNDKEQTEMVLAAAQYLDDDTILKKLPFLTADEVKTILENKSAQDLKRLDIIEE